MTARGWGSSRQTFRNAENSTAAASPTVPPEEGPFGDWIEVPAVLQDAGDEFPCAGARERRFARLRIEPMQQVRPELHEEKHLRRDSVRRAPGAPVLGVDPDLQMDEARCERGRHAMHDAAVGFAVAAGDQRGALGQFVLADLAVEHQLIERRLHHRHRRRQLLQVDEPAAGIVGGRQEGGRRPAGAVGAVAPRDAAQVHGVEQERPDVDILAAGIGGDLLGDGALGAARSSPQDHRLAGLDQQREGGGELANVAPDLLDAYRADELDLEVLKAFSVTPDHARGRSV